MLKAKLGFGMMRLPLIDPEDTSRNVDMNRMNIFDAEHKLHIDMEQVCDMVDAFIEGGGTYFDTSYVYLGGRSEGIVREAVVKRYPRDAYTLTTKFPAQLVTEESHIASIFEEQLTNCGVDYFDYYLLHTVQNTTYDPYVVPLGMFEFFEKEKERGRVKKLGFSFHGSPELLNRILTDYPEIDVVQIVINYYDWESYFVRSRECYEIIRQHGKQVVVMQPVKGGMLADVPEPVRKMMEKAQPGLSPTAWALQYVAGLDGVLAVLSGMSTVGQVKENISLFKNARPLTPIETSILRQAVPIMKTSGPLHRSDFSIYEDIVQNGMPVAGILDAYNSCMIQTDPSFGAENAYYKNYRHDAGIPAGQSWVDGKLIDREGNDITDLVRKAEEWLLENTY